MGSLFYLVGVLNAMYVIMWVLLIVSVGIFGGMMVSKALDNDEDWMSEKDKKVERKSKKLSSIVGIISMLYILFVPSGDTYLKMKIADKIGEQRVEDVFDLLDKKLMDAVEDAELIDYE